MEKIEEEFNDLVGVLTDDEFWNYVRSWFSDDFILDTMNNWEDEVKAEEIKKIKEIIKNRK